MKHLLIILLTSMFIVSTASADMSFRDLGLHSIVNSNSTAFAISTKCIDGYKWVLLFHNMKRLETPMSIILEQFYVEKNGVTVPAIC